MRIVEDSITIAKGEPIDLSQRIIDRIISIVDRETIPDNITTGLILLSDDLQYILYEGAEKEFAVEDCISPDRFAKSFINYISSSIVKRYNIRGFCDTYSGTEDIDMSVLQIPHYLGLVFVILIKII